MSREAHPSEALLATFDHDAIEVEFFTSIQAHQARITALALAALFSTLTVGVVVGLVGAGEPEAALGVGVTMAGTLVFLQALVFWFARRIHLLIRPDALTVVTRIFGREVRRREIPLGELRAIHSVQANQYGAQHRGLRLALTGGEELFLSAPTVPVESLGWLADEIRGVAYSAAQFDDEQAPRELLALLSDDTKEQVEAAARVRRAAAARASRER